MRFSPTNPIVQLCMKGMRHEEGGDAQEARDAFERAWRDATDDHERFLVAYHMFRQQEVVADQLEWLQTALDLAEKVDDVSVAAALPLLYSNLAERHQGLGETDTAERYRELAAGSQTRPLDRGPFYHGTRAALQVGELLSAGNRSNYQSDLVMNHVYFTALVDGAGLAAALAQGDGPERVYVVEPTGSFEDDPNVTNKRFPGNPTRSYRSEAPLEIVGEASDWERPAPEEIRRWRQRLADGKPNIIN